MKAGRAADDENYRFIFILTIVFNRKNTIVIVVSQLFCIFVLNFLGSSKARKTTFFFP